MKTYSEQMNRISKDELLKGLVGYGLFPEKLPPFLSSEAFYNHIESGSNLNFTAVKETGFFEYESMRNINIPRVLGIPNPFAYFNLCECLSKNWENLCQHFYENSKDWTHKISRIHIRKISENSKKIFQLDYEGTSWYWLESGHRDNLFSMNYKDFKEDGNPVSKLLIRSTYLVNADISNCFGSIYTHALSWSLVGKDIAKQERFGKWHNDIDKLSSSLKQGETHGILIGPHASSVLSEIILVAVDNELSRNYKFIRNVDDYSCYTKSHEEAERFLLDLSDALKKYGLSLNHKKTEILKLPLVSKQNWIRELNLCTQNLDEDVECTYPQLAAILDTAVNLMLIHKNSAILNYVIKILQYTKLTDSANEYFIDTLHHWILIYPYLIPLLEEYVFTQREISKQKLEEVVNDIYYMGLEKKTYEAVSYALYFAIGYDLSLSTHNYEKIEKSNDAVLLLLGYLYDKKNRVGKSVLGKYKEYAKLKAENEMDKYWIFCFEVLTTGLLKDNWKKLKKDNITFVKPEFLKKIVEK
ncbi:RNA-directed DNA polymerase [Vitreoscilla massiliensis]|uniref:RNA-directed DNA polymerase n=1 Tax=Vitreoscilla massiliensis TaxID=1689272 RepID=UPI00071D1AE0|nr:RNA-directed DNA polymerase [Vitreoscilla massiliensis]